jgi:Mn2+/Fe2+ NRAMP family transporter
MGIYYTLIAGLVLWIVLWAIGVKAFDAFLLTIVMLIVAATVHLVMPFLPGNRRPR